MEINTAMGTTPLNSSLIRPTPSSSVVYIPLDRLVIFIFDDYNALCDENKSPCPIVFFKHAAGCISVKRKIKLKIPKKTIINYSSDSTAVSSDGASSGCKGLWSDALKNINGTFHCEAYPLLLRSVCDINERLEKLTQNQETEGEFLRIRDDDSIDEAKSEMGQFVKQEYEKISSRLDRNLLELREEDTTLAWAIEKQFFDVCEMTHTQQKIVRRLDELSMQQNRLADALNLMLKSRCNNFQELFPEEYHIRNLRPYRGWRRRDGRKMSFKEWRADPAEAIHRPLPIRTDFIYRSSDLPLLTKSEVDEHVKYSKQSSTKDNNRRLSAVVQSKADGVSRESKRRKTARACL